MIKKVSIGCDHAGFDYKEQIKQYLAENNIECIDRGTNSPDSVDYPDFAHQVAKDVDEGHVEAGILLCGSANGVSMTANKYANVRCGLCWTNEIVELVRLHNNANIVALPARFISPHQAVEFVKTFLSTEFEGGRHARRVDKIACSPVL